MKSLRTISPYLSIILVSLMLAGSQGYFFVFHACQDCRNQEVMHSIEMTANGECHLCGEIDLRSQEGSQAGHYLRHHCQPEVERLITTDLVKTELQNNIALFYPSSLIVLVSPDNFSTKKNAIIPGAVKKEGRDLATFHCQILS